MELFSLTQPFGSGAFQDGEVLVIQKSSLSRLTPLINNTAESLLAGILTTALQNFQGIITDENNQAITDENNQSIFYDNSEAFEFIKMFDWLPFFTLRSNQPCIVHQIIVENYA